jgi:hypothetical protein
MSKRKRGRPGWTPKIIRSIQSARAPKIRNRPVTLAKTWEPKK